MQKQKIEPGSVCKLLYPSEFVSRISGLKRAHISHAKVHVFRVNDNGTCMVETLSNHWEARVKLVDLELLSPLEQLAFHAE